MGSGYVAGAGTAGDVLSLEHSASGLGGCSWEGTLHSKLFFDPDVSNAASEWRHPSNFFMNRTAFNCGYSPRADLWHYFHEKPALTLQYSTATASRQGDCSSVVAPVMAPAPYRVSSSATSFNADKSDGGWSDFGDSAPLKVGQSSSTSAERALWAGWQRNVYPIACVPLLFGPFC